MTKAKSTDHSKDSAISRRKIKAITIVQNTASSSFRFASRASGTYQAHTRVE
jgi:hypothetical protein